ncbi:MAG TPA: TonB family protein [Pyrinomonadaceae bacterium]|nr:TonB family protein [Pyrinomonadaceae bacterium]
MFDKLIESNSVQADFKGRSRYFLVSSVVVGILFLAAVVASLYAADIDIGTGEFDMSRMLAPEVVDAPERVEDEPARAVASAATSELPRRNQNMQQVAESPADIPAGVSTVQNTSKARPYGRSFEVGDGPESDGSSVRGTGIGPGSGGSEKATGLAEEIASAVKPVESTEPPPVRKAGPPPIKSLGVINGRAINLQTPPYPPHALAVGVQGDVSVQVLIDEEGRVISAKAIDGHALLRPTAVNAAKRTRFIPTQLSLKPVKATGIIVYKFKRN